MFTPNEISEMMKEYNQLIDRCVQIKSAVTAWTNQWMEKYDTSSVQPDELSEVFFQNVWCIPEALEQNLEFIDKWCPKIPEGPTIIDGEYREISEDKNSEE